MPLPILFLFITGCFTQTQTQTESTDQKLDRILASIVDATNGRVLDHSRFVDELNSVILAANEFNQTLNHLLEENETLRKRQAAVAAISVSQLLIVIIYLLVIGVSYLVKRCKKHQEKLAEEELELIETRLQERKSKRRAAASRTQSISPQE